MNILWILEDALRPDHMGCYGYSRNTTPHCDRLAAEGVRFENVIATASHTVPAVVSMLTGLTTATHRMVTPDRYAGWLMESVPAKRKTPLHDLHEKGYLLDVEAPTSWGPLGLTRETAGKDVEAYFERNRRNKWFFLAQPYFTHLPYNPPREYYEMFLETGYEPDAATLKNLDIVRSTMIVHPPGVVSKMEAGEEEALPDNDHDEAHRRTVGVASFRPEDKPGITALYDGEVRVFDDLVGRYVAKLKDLGIIDDTLIVVVSDHGEELLERGHVGHCSCNLNGTLYDEALKVPLVMRWPGKLPRGKVIRNQISLVDIMPTVFDLLGLTSSEPMEGCTTMPLVRGTHNAFREEAYAETIPAGWQALKADDREIWCVRTRRSKLILYTHTSGTKQDYRFYNLVKDPGETQNVFDPDKVEVRDLKNKLDAYVARARAQGMPPKS